MGAERIVHCGGAARTDLIGSQAEVLTLDAVHDANVFVELSDLAPEEWVVIPQAMQDLVELAAYVYAADQAVSRGPATDPEYGTDWRRRFRFAVAVREPDLWRQPEVAAALAEVLSFLSEDHYDFRFQALTRDRRGVAHLGLKGSPLEGVFDDVALFSGGLDSLAGAAEAGATGRRLLLVHHRSNPKATRLHEFLTAALRDRAAPQARPVHRAVRVHKDQKLGRESTQRTRSFLFAALAATAAWLAGRDRILFFENGVTSINLPLATQVVGARASRTTHPLVLRGLGRLFTALLGRRFTVENLFQRRTKEEVVRALHGAGCADLIEHSRSCANTRHASNAQPHCGACSQCLDRRVAVLAAGLEENDPEGMYQVPLFLGARQRGRDQILAAAYFEHARRIARMTQAEFFARYGEASRVLEALDGPVSANAEAVFDLYRRHSLAVRKVLTDGLTRHREEVLDRSLPETCLLRMVWPGSGGAVAERQPSGSPCVFRRDSDGWEIRFNGGKTFRQKDSVGLRILHRLLSRPGRAFSAAELAEEDRPPEGLARPGDAGPTVDAQYRREVRERLQELQRELAEANAEGDVPLAAVKQGEIEELIGQTQRDMGRKGRPRREADQADRIRSQVAMALKRAIDRLLTHDTALVQHLRSWHLQRGHRLCYTPPEGVCWDTQEQAGS